MSGIVGLCSKHALDLSYVSKLIEDMSKEITYVSADLVDRWTDDNLAVARVHHGIVNPETQPVFNEDRSLCITMSGEVFDYRSSRRELIQQGHVFRLKDNDVEYCLHLYEEKGLESFARLNGSFVIVLYDLDLHELLLVSDRFSSHHLFPPVRLTQVTLVLAGKLYISGRSTQAQRLKQLCLGRGRCTLLHAPRSEQDGAIERA